MKENKYDESVFFNKYSQMPRSQLGLAGAGEWPTFRELLPDFTGKTVLDLGCGYGWHCRYMMGKGAASVLGIDLSEKMLETARQTNSGEGITYRQGAIEDVDFEDETFDIVFSSLAFHYVRDFMPLVGRMHRWLKPGGCLAFSVEHPVFTAQGPQNWCFNQYGGIDHFPVDDYAYEGEREAWFLGEPIVKYHRTLTTYIEGLLRNGFALKHVVEPVPPAHMMDMPGMRDEFRRPMMLLIVAEKTV